MIYPDICTVFIIADKIYTKAEGAMKHQVEREYFTPRVWFIESIIQKEE